MIKVKGSVRPRSLVIAAAVANVAQTLGLTVTITSGNDSTHMQGSLHYVDRALDVRTKDMGDAEMKRSFLRAVLARLGSDYQGVLEDLGGPNEHAHFEHDPRPGSTTA